MIRSKTSWLMLLGAFALGCSPAEESQGGSGAGAGGAGVGGLGGIGGVAAGTGGVGGSAGMAAGAGGMAGMTAGTGGMAGMAAGTGGMAGMAAGTGGSGGTGGMGGMPAPLAPTFTNIVDNILPGCAGPTCHSSVAGGNLMLQGDKMAVYMALVGTDAMGVNLPPDPTKMNCKDLGLKRVNPGMPEMSVLYLKVQTAMDPPCGLRMPTGGMLPADKVELIRAWIAAGANND
jgi:hypothetical protein